MRRWYDSEKQLTYVRIDQESELRAWTAYLSWRDIRHKFGCSRSTAMRCLHDLEQLAPYAREVTDWYIVVLIRIPGQRARTERRALCERVSLWFATRRSVGNPMFTDSAYQSNLASRPRGLH